MNLPVVKPVFRTKQAALTANCKSSNKAQMQAPQSPGAAGSSCSHYVSAFAVINCIYSVFALSKALSTNFNNTHSGSSWVPCLLASQRAEPPFLKTDGTQLPVGGEYDGPRPPGQRRAQRVAQGMGRVRDRRKLRKHNSFRLWSNFKHLRKTELWRN